MMIFKRNRMYTGRLLFNTGFDVLLKVDTGAFSSVISERALLLSHPHNLELYEVLHSADSLKGRGLGGIVDLVPCVLNNVTVAGAEIDKFYFLCSVNGSEDNLLGVDFIGNCMGSYTKTEFNAFSIDMMSYREEFYESISGVDIIEVNSVQYLSYISETLSLNPFDEYCDKYGIVYRDEEIKRLCSIYGVSVITKCYDRIREDFL